MGKIGISGFTFCRNVVSLGYPFIESINSILPVVDEYIIVVGKSSDSTLQELQKIKSSKIKIYESEWDENLKKEARVLQQQANFALSKCKFPWAFHLQVDEVVHEEDLPGLVEIMKNNLKNKTALGLMFRFLHFHLDYFTINPWGFRREVRIIRNDGSLRSAGDSCGFVRKTDGLYLNKKLLGKEVIWSGARIFHYSSVMPQEELLSKAKAMTSIRVGNWSEEDKKVQAQKIVENLISKYEIMKEYKGTHPKVMRERLCSAQRFKKRINRWLNWRFYRHFLIYGFKG